MSSCSVLRAAHCLRASEALGTYIATAPASARGAARILKGASLPAGELQRRQAHWRIKSSQRIQQQSSDGWRPGRELFGRAAELEWMGELHRHEPVAIQVLVGPRSCGKTALLHEFQARNPNVVYIDCRDYDTSSPAQLIAELLTRALHRALQRAPSTFFEQMVERLFKSAPSAAALLSKVTGTASISEAVKFQLSISDLRAALRGLLTGPEREATTATVVAEIRALVKDLQPKDKTDIWPVIIVDEVNELMVWREDHPRDVRNLLSFLVQISKQARQCHVVLATSEFGFVDWLSQAIGPGYWESAVIGDFGEDDARDFLHWALQKRGENCTLDDAGWARVYEVCGGNAGDLVRLSAKLTFPINTTSLDKALKAVRSRESNRVKQMARGGDGWTGAQFAAAALRLLDSPHHAVPREDMEALLGQHASDASLSDQGQELAGAVALRSLVMGNALAVRPYSGLPQDIPEEAFLVEGEPTDMVTAPSAMSLYCMARLRRNLEGKIAEGQTQHA